MTLTLFGLTGGIASGKSTVAAWFRSAGVAVIDADQIARTVVQRGTPAYGAIVERFGRDTVDADGNILRAKVAQIVFADANERAWLQEITHPAIEAQALRQAALLAQQGACLACYEAALLVETGTHEKYRPLVVTHVERDVQVQRLLDRDSITASEAMHRIDAQLDARAKIAVADYVIDTSGSLALVQHRARDVLLDICCKHGIDVTRFRL